MNQRQWGSWPTSTRCTSSSRRSLDVSVRRQAEVLEYLIEENRVLKEQLKGRRFNLSDDQRRRLAAKGKRIGRRLLMQVATIVTPDTILRWHRKLVAKTFDSSDKRRPGRPRIRQEVVDAIVRFARENPIWGYDRIQGALANIGYHIADSTVETPAVDKIVAPNRS